MSEGLGKAGVSRDGHLIVFQTGRWERNRALPTELRGIVGIWVELSQVLYRSRHIHRQVQKGEPRFERYTVF